MGITNYPQGIASFGVPLLGSGPIMAAGEVFWVSSTAGFAAGATGDFDNPFPSLTAALADSRVKTNSDVTIMIKARHEETIAGPTVLTLSKSGIRVQGLGRGRQRPTFILTTAITANVLLSGSYNQLDNLIFVATAFDATTAMMTITGNDNIVSNCEFIMADASEQAALGILISTGASRTQVRQCHFQSSDAGATAAIQIVAAVDAVIIANNHFTGDYGTAAISNITAACTNCRLLHNSMYGTNASEPIIEMITGATGIAAGNIMYGATFSATGSVVGDAIAKFENYVTDNLANSGILDPTGVTL